MVRSPGHGIARWLGLVLLLVGVAAAGPFEKVPAGDATYHDLNLLKRQGLLTSSVTRYQPGQTVTRFDAARLWQDAYRELMARPVAAVPTDRQPDPDVEAVAGAMLRLLGTYEAELGLLELNTADARDALNRLPHRLASLAEPEAPRSTHSTGRDDSFTLPGARGGAGRSVLPPALGLEPFNRREENPLRPGTTDISGARLPTASLGPAEAGLGLSRVRMFDYTPDGEATLTSGHVLAADLRLRLGDESVRVEYLLSLLDDSLGSPDGDQGRAWKATYLQKVGEHLRLELGVSRLSSRFVPFSGLFGPEGGPDLTGLTAGVAWNGQKWGVESTGSVFRPDGTSDGYANQFGARMAYRPTDNWSISLGFQSTTRQRLANLEDVWHNVITGGLSYDATSAIRANVNYRFDMGDTGGRAGETEHLIGASLGLGF